MLPLTINHYCHFISNPNKTCQLKFCTTSSNFKAVTINLYLNLMLLIHQTLIILSPSHNTICIERDAVRTCHQWNHMIWYAPSCCHWWNCPGKPGRCHNAAIHHKYIQKTQQLYKQVFQELSVDDSGIILWGDYMIILPTIQEKIVCMSHEGQKGIIKEKQLIHSTTDSLYNWDSLQLK